MFKFKIKNRNLLLFILALIFIIATFCVVAFGREQVFAKAESVTESASNETNYNNYTNSDSLLNNAAYTIQDYPQLIATQGAVALIPGALSHFELQNLDNDDPIVDIVPKNLFYEVGDHVFVGQEYGFFIKTQAYNTDYKSTVMVFDIITNTNLVETIDRVITTVTPIFQYEYIGLTGISKSVMINGYYLNYQLSEPCVIPYPSKMENTTFVKEIKHEMVERYFLKDISFGASLYNEQTLNRYDEGYDPYNDYGSYFTGFDYTYNGKYRASGAFPGEDLGWNIADTIFYGLGFLDAIPLVGTVTSIIGQVYDTASLAHDWATFGVDTYNSSAGTIETVGKKITATCYYQNRDDQLRYYKDENNVPYLIKTAALGINTDSENSIWYGLNDDVTGYFNIGHSALNGRIPEYTRFTNQIVLKIVDSSGDKLITTASTITNNKIRNPYYKDLNLDKTGYIYLLPDGENYFTFNAALASDYDIKINSSENIKVFVNDELHEGTQLNISKSFSENSIINLKICGNKNGVYAPITISPRSILSGINLPSQKNYLVKLGYVSGVKKIETNYSGINIKNFYLYGEPELNPYENYGYVKPHDDITYPFSPGNYYAVLYNTSTSSRAGVSLTISEIPTISLGSINTVKLTPNLTFYKFTSPVGGGRFIQTITNTSRNDFTYKMLDTYLNPITNGYSHTNGEYIISLEGNKTYYIAATTGAVETNAKIVLNKAANAYKWQVTGGSYSNYKTYDRELYLKRGYTYTLSFWINDQICDTRIFSEDDPHNYYGGYNIAVSPSTGKLNIPLTTPIGGSGITVKAKYFNTDASYDHTLKVIPEFENTINYISTFNSTDYGFTFTAPKYVKAYDYSISIGGNTRTYSNQSISNYANSTNNVSKSIASNYDSLGYTGVGYIQIKITKLYVSTAVNGTATYTCNFSTQVHNLFKGGQGTTNDPFTLDCYRHLENIRKAASGSRLNYSFKMLDHIYIPWANTGYFWDTRWKCLPNFYGTFDGNGNTIVTPNIVINKNDAFTDSEQGFFRINYGIIKNLSIYDAATSTYRQESYNPGKTIYVGMFAGSNYGTIENCHYDSENLDMCFFVPNAYVGGIVGWNNGTIKNCTVTSWNIDGFGHKGGIAGYNGVTGIIENCKTYGHVTNRYDSPDQSTQYSAGGIVGINYGEVKSCTNYATIQFYCQSIDGTSESRTLQPRMGYIIGTNHGVMMDVHNYGNMDTSSLKLVSWTTGALWWKETHYFNQKAFAMGYLCGESFI